MNEFFDWLEKLSTSQEEYEKWVRDMQIAIQAAVIARLAQDNIAEGRGPGSKESYLDWAEEGQACAEAWKEAVVEKEERKDNV